MHTSPAKPVELKIATTQQDVLQADTIVVLYDDLKACGSRAKQYQTTLSAIESYAKFDPSLDSNATLIVKDEKRIISASVGNLNTDTSDVRLIFDAVRKGIRRAIDCKAENVGLIFPNFIESVDKRVGSLFSNYWQVIVLAVLSELYVPIEVREENRTTFWPSIKSVTLDWIDGRPIELTEVQTQLSQLLSLDFGRSVAKDIGGPDPERMTAYNACSYIESVFLNAPNIKLTVIKDLNVLQKEYPLLHAVARASIPVERHHPCVIKIEYKSPNPEKVEENLFFVGKGITYDTGGIDVKTNGAMVGMSRDKCGAAAVAGFLSVVAKLQPKHLNVSCSLAFVRNSIGSLGYVSDEIITSRAGTRVRVGNTDAEGRMVMSDLLAEMKEIIVSKSIPNARLFTCATLTGHAVRAMGPYAIAMSNRLGAIEKISERLFNVSHLWADPFEISHLRREDMNYVKPTSCREDVVQSKSKPSTMVNRGHQYPMAFMIYASGLQKHQIGDAFPISFTHLDIAGSADEPSGHELAPVTGSPVTALTATFIFNKK